MTLISERSGLARNHDSSAGARGRQAVTQSMVIGACVLWGFLLLSGLSYLLAEAEDARPLSESRARRRLACRYADIDGVFQRARGIDRKSTRLNSSHT